MNKIISFLKKSNRYKHLVGGFIVGLCALSPWSAIYSAIIAASCLELKDRRLPLGLDRLGLHGVRWLHCHAVLVHCVIFLQVLHRYSVTLQPVELPNRPCGLSRLQ